MKITVSNAKEYLIKNGEEKTMKTLGYVKQVLGAGLLSVVIAGNSWATDVSDHIKKEAQSDVVQSVQDSVDEIGNQKTEEKRKALTSEAIAAISETKRALKFLDENNSEEAIKALALATGKLELIVARDPALALAPIEVDINMLDLLATKKTIKKTIKTVEDLIDSGEIQLARPIMAYLASELQIATTSIPLASYPAAIKAVTPLIDKGKIDEAKLALQAALNTLVITEEIIPLPALRASELLAVAEELAEKSDRTDEENKEFGVLLDSAREQLEIASLLGYGEKKSYKPMYQQIDEIEKRASAGDDGKGWFDKVKKQISDLTN